MKSATFRRNWAEAKSRLREFQEALKIRRDIGDKRGLGSTLLDFGNFVDDRGDHDQALKLYTESCRSSVILAMRACGRSA
jgi:hypothetical protein